ncbi:hypothetical protein ZWY2020_018861 [Hordeum vulgare]|nr:hypothetical protein ZWY2020_018861 [Hordeum vulgare]
MENRSFDHVLGWLRATRPDIDGLTGKESNHLNASDPSSPEIFVTDKAGYVDSDPGHGFEDIREQIFGFADTSAVPPSMSGFAQNARDMGLGMAQNVMSGFAPDSVPVYAALADEFTVFDRWFASVPTSTQPNRLFVHSATSHGLTFNARKDLINGFPQKTIFDSLEEDGLSFGIYYQNIPATLFYQSLRRLKHLVKFHQYSLRFKLDAARGKLPNYVVIEQRYFDCKEFPANDDHPRTTSPGARGSSRRSTRRCGRALSGTRPLSSSPMMSMVASMTMSPRPSPRPSSKCLSLMGLLALTLTSSSLTGLGCVPSFLISPWIEKGTVIHEPNGPQEYSQYEHSSIPATVKKLFNLRANYLTKRDAWAGTFEDYLKVRKTPRTDCPEKLPELNGDHVLNSYPDIGKTMSVGEANRYAEDAVSRFLEAGRIALRAGANESALVTMRPALTSRAAMSTGLSSEL